MELRGGSFFVVVLCSERGSIGRADGRAGRGQREEVPVRCGAESVVWWDGGWTGGRERSVQRGSGRGAAAMRDRRVPELLTGFRWVLSWFCDDADAEMVS